jgi:hypothetical protein
VECEFFIIFKEQKLLTIKIELGQHYNNAAKEKGGLNLEI